MAQSKNIDDDISQFLITELLRLSEFPTVKAFKFTTAISESFNITTIFHYECQFPTDDNTSFLLMFLFTNQKDPFICSIKPAVASTPNALQV